MLPDRTRCRRTVVHWLYFEAPIPLDPYDPHARDEQRRDAVAAMFLCSRVKRQVVVPAASSR